jgi:FlaA1/EpsC-like NDP-sugar epimerase
MMVPVAWLGAFSLRFNLQTVPEVHLSVAYDLLPLVMGVSACVFWLHGLYRGVWRFASLPDLVRIFQAVVVSVATIAVLILLWTGMQDLPRSVLPLHALLLMMLLGGPRLAYRWVKDRQFVIGNAQNVLIVGAGDAGERLVREMRREVRFGYVPVGFVDDDQAKRGLEIQGVRVLAKCARLAQIVDDRSIDLVVLAIPSATAAERRRLVGLCEQADVPVRTMPDLNEIMAGRAQIADLRELSIEDLLGRDPVSLDWQSIRQGVADRTVLVTGGAGSIGSELCRQLARLGPRRLVVLDQNEFGLYTIDEQLREAHPDLDFTISLRDVCDRPAMERLFADERPDVVFHAAAYKHVPMLERQMREAVRNNVLGARHVAECSVANSVGTVVLISTDKAVNPTNVMGATKRIAEVYCQNADIQASDTRFVTVRFGNVLGSAGSVVPRFRAQIAAGGPVTVTHPEMQRYFMTIPEACQLIMEAGTVGEGGEIFVLDMGDPVKIEYLAEQMITLAGKRPRDDIAITYTGLRPGEKLFEELFHEQEALRATKSDKLLLAKVRQVDWIWLNRKLDELLSACDRYDENRLRALIAELVPEYQAAPPRKDNVIPLERAS